MVRPHVAIITTIQPVHLAAFASLEAIAEEKADIFWELEPGGTAIVNADIPQIGAAARYRQVRAGRADHHLRRKPGCRCPARSPARSSRTCLVVEARVFGEPVTYRLGSPGKHIVLNSLGVLAVVHALGADLALAALALGDLRPPAGRGARQILQARGRRDHADRRELQRQPRLDAGRDRESGRLPVDGRGRRIAVLGDMLELGPSGADLPSRARRAARGQHDRPGLRLWAADERAL